MKSLAILGASGHGKVVADAASISGWGSIVFYDDAWKEMPANAYWPVAGGFAELIRDREKYDGCVVGIGNNTIRLEKSRELAQAGLSLVSIVHPNAQLSSKSELGRGSVVFAGAVVNIDARIGFSSIINTAASIDHDCVLADGIHICPGAHLAGGVKVGEMSMVGIGASVVQCVNIGKNVTVGAGSVVIRDVEDGSTVTGVPAIEHK